MGGSQSLNATQFNSMIDPTSLIAEVAKQTGASSSDCMQAAALFQNLLPVMGALGGSLPVQEEMQDHRAVLQLAAAMKQDISSKVWWIFTSTRALKLRGSN